MLVQELGSTLRGSVAPMRLYRQCEAHVFTCLHNLSIMWPAQATGIMYALWDFTEDIYHFPYILSRWRVGDDQNNGYHTGMWVLQLLKTS